MQKFILIILILGLGFFLYLINTGDINSSDFNISKFKNPVQFVVKKVEVSRSEISSTIYLNVRENEYKMYTFTGSSFEHIPRSEYYMSRYNVPVDALDAVTGTWLGSRYIFYVMQEGNGKSVDEVYKIYKTEYPTDSTYPVTYIQIQTIKGLEATGKIDVRY